MITTTPAGRWPIAIGILCLGMLWIQLDSCTMRASTLQVYVGTYTGGDSEGIYVFDWDSETGKATSDVSLAAESENPSFLALHPSKPLLYAVNETASFDGQESGSVSAFRINPKGRHLEAINQKASRGKAPCHIQIDSTGRHALIANYSSGTVSALPILEDGSLGNTADVVEHLGSSVNPQRQEGPHAHCINLDPENRYAAAADLGVDKVFVYPFEADTGHFNLYKATSVSLKPGAGPRHLAFHPKKPYAYVINELDNTLSALSFKASNGKMTEIQSLSTLPDGFDETSYTAEVFFHPSGEFLYGSNRGHDSIAVFKVDSESGKCRVIEHESTQGKTPRSFGIDPSGRFLLAANQASDSIVVFRINAQTGALDPTGEMIEVPTPVCVIFR